MSDPVSQMGADPCPNCGAPLSPEVIARAAAKSVVTFAMVPQPGELLQASVVARGLWAIQESVRQAGADHRVPTEALVQSIETSADGAVTFKVLIVRWETAERYAAKRKEEAHE